ncbi:hypothetical protein [Rubrivirga sp.]|uniref:hypothetical protein n=1 Tax=Rubrivirga sp. TaxID=1885344 RepID=UPI003B51DC6C
MEHSGRSVEVSGELTLASTPLGTGVEAVVSRETFGPPVPEQRYTFERGGQLRVTEPGFTGGLDVREGQWSAADGRVRLQLPRTADHDAVDESLAYRVERGVLTLDPAGETCSADTRLLVVSRALLIPGTVATCRAEQTRTFRTAAS